MIDRLNLCYYADLNQLAMRVRIGEEKYFEEALKVWAKRRALTIKSINWSEPHHSDGEWGRISRKRVLVDFK